VRRRRIQSHIVEETKKRLLPIRTGIERAGPRVMQNTGPAAQMMKVLTPDETLSMKTTRNDGADEKNENFVKRKGTGTTMRNADVGERTGVDENAVMRMTRREQDDARNENCAKNDERLDEGLTTGVRTKMACLSQLDLLGVLLIIKVRMKIPSRKRRNVTRDDKNEGAFGRVSMMMTIRQNQSDGIGNWSGVVLKALRLIIIRGILKG
jgi:hypothetical protein